MIDLTALDSAALARIEPAQLDEFPEQLIELEASSGAQPASGSPSQVAHFGTYRAMLRLNPGDTYVLSHTSAHHALRVFIDGTEIAAVGTVGAGAAESRAYAGTMLGAFTATEPEVELVIQQSNFIRDYALNTLYLGSVATIAQHHRVSLLRTCLFAACILTAGLLHIGMYLFFGRKPQFVMFSLYCFGLSVYLMVTGEIALSILMPVSGELIARLEYLAVAFLAAVLYTYINTAFNGIVRRAAVYAMYACSGVLSLVFLFADPLFFTRQRLVYLAVLAVLYGYMLLRLFASIRKALPEQILMMSGIILLLVTILLEMFVLRWYAPFSGLPALLSSTAMVVTIFLNMIGLALHANRIELALAEANRTEKELLLANQSLDRLNLLKDEFIRTISHEMRTPLTVMSGYAQLSAWKLRNNLAEADIPSDLDLITQEANRLSLLVSQLLRLDHPTPDVYDKVCAPHLVIDRCAALYRPVAMKKNNELLCSVQPDAPLVPLGAAALTQVLFNLLDNANRHTSDGRIEIILTVLEDMVRIAVRDNGEGIDPQMLPRIFGKGTHGDHAESNGLGLAICQEIVKAAGGEMGASSIRGEDTQVWACLPRVRPDR